MPPRFPTQSSLRAFTGSSSIQSPFAALSLNPAKTSVRAGSAEARERKRHDPFLQAQSRLRKSANINRQQTLSKEREEALGHPFLSQATPFIEEITKRQSAPSDPKLNYFVTPEGLQQSLEHSKDLTSPLRNPDRDTADPQLEEEAAEKHAQEHKNAMEAIRRIVSVGNGNTKDHMRLHTQSCIEKFGRHNTDKRMHIGRSFRSLTATGVPKDAVGAEGSVDISDPRDLKMLEESEQDRLRGYVKRAGKDTGSPEVQIAIFTIHILNLIQHLKKARQDKHNKRNLLVLVHKRQKMLRYLRKKDRGGPRFENVMKELGLSDAAWKGEISLDNIDLRS
ncbi:putative ribosomal protein S15 [Aspergillus ellipticus CBS 707.79]|uniref:Putative ribosomal protein S15 n=1 Tax=Aspergillus ellipticus CBS 707.79 TaxID=1448320 RepID=A0A319DKP3_9EURO|nr:putative ribosomal protein S15 [Aspergillus ellipticus CBS 707.79]